MLGLHRENFTAFDFNFLIYILQEKKKIYMKALNFFTILAQLSLDMHYEFRHILTHDAAFKSVLFQLRIKDVTFVNNVFYKSHL